MKVGLDALTLKAVSLDPLELLQQTRAHGLEGLHFSTRLLQGCDEAYVDRLSEKRRRRAGCILNWREPVSTPVEAGGASPRWWQSGSLFSPWPGG